MSQGLLTKAIVTDQHPTQAVILAGGRGTRLRPITDTIPKPMLEFHGKPFLEYLIELLAEQGFRNVLLLLGYLPGIIQEYFGDGSRWGINIEYSVTSVGNDTGRRIRLASDHIADHFLLMYCDNYWPMRLDDMWKQYVDSGVPAMVTVYSNEDGYTRSNIRLDDEGFVSVYDKDRSARDLGGVDIGYALMTKSVVDKLPDSNVNFESLIYPGLVEKRQLKGYLTHHRYYSVGSHERLPITDTFLARNPTIFLDRDGVLNEKPPRAEYVKTWDEFKWMPGSLEALRVLKASGYKVIVISNQAGIARGVMSEASLTDIHDRMTFDIREAGGEIEAMYYCPHGWDEGCKCRKPSPGMLYQAQRDHHLDLSRTCFIGDDERDAEAAEAAGCPWQLVSQDRSLVDIVREFSGNERVC